MTAEKKVALITGANRGLGFETARQLGQNGIILVLGARKLRDAESTAAKLTQEGFETFPIQLDVTSDSDRQAAAAYLSKRFGHLDILINNAGISPPIAAGNQTSNTTDEELRRIFDTNFFSVVQLTRTLLPLLKKSDAGRIVNLSSILGSLTLHADPKSPIKDFKVFSYDASKAALNAFTIHLADELKDTPIKVNSVHPGWVKTEMGTNAAPMEIPDGAKTSVQAALLAADGPNGRFFHMGKDLPW